MFNLWTLIIGDNFKYSVGTDDGNSFGDVLYYGNEILLFVFDALLFCLVDLLGRNLILDAVVTLIVSKVSLNKLLYSEGRLIISYA